MPLPALLAAGLIGLAIGVIGSDAETKEEAGKERDRHEEEKKAAWLEIARERARQRPAGCVPRAFLARRARAEMETLPELC